MSGRRSEVDHRHDLERVVQWSRASVVALMGALALSPPDDVRWNTTWHPTLAQVSAVIGVVQVAAMALTVLRLRHFSDGRYRWVATAQTSFDVLAVVAPVLVINSVAGVPLWPSAVLALLSASTRHKLTGVLIAWTVVATAVVTGALLGNGAPDSPHGAGVVLAILVLLVASATAGAQARSLDRYVAELQNARLAMTRQARTDALTGTANRIALDEHEAALPPGPVSLVLLDLDGFKTVNDTYGHHAGDLLLKTVAIRLQSRLRAEDLLVRLGGDEFVIVLPGLPTDEVDAVIHRWVRAVAEPVPIGDDTVRVGVSVGVAHRAANDDACFADLLRTADRRMYHDKHAKDDRPEALTGQR
ncbi:GGDEF domain-containing protein [Winogradskya humida]|uniref:GGDEF domain-containing protein n=1 Tax=Winogradskya humida TaxID=113566 RepID=A0ABQ3ZYK7_9ACTN|nr:GGDEF domain-containing protein [Actinoplanes humidus]GIE23669.1 hypothetical protein Ahu01nite_067710 [Actinoplanes humidus]